MITKAIALRDEINPIYRLFVNISIMLFWGEPNCPSEMNMPTLTLLKVAGIYRHVLGYPTHQRATDVSNRLRPARRNRAICLDNHYDVSGGAQTQALR